MNKTYQKIFPGEKNAGFTLIELLVVVLIIGILAAVAVPKYQRAVEKSQFVSGFSLAKTLAQQQEVFFLANGDYAKSLSQLDIDMPNGCKTCYAYGTESLCCGENLMYQFNHGWRGVLVANFCPGKAQSEDSAQCYYSGSKVAYYIYYDHAGDYFAPYAGQRKCSPPKNYLCTAFCEQFGCN